MKNQTINRTIASQFTIFPAASVSEVNFTYELSLFFSLGARDKQRNQRSRRVRFPWLFKQTRIAGLRAPPRVMNNRDSLHGPFCALLFFPSRAGRRGDRL